MKDSYSFSLAKAGVGIQFMTFLNNNGNSVSTRLLPKRHFGKLEMVHFRKETAFSGTILNLFSFDVLPDGMKEMGRIPSNVMRQNSNRNAGTVYTPL